MVAVASISAPPDPPDSLTRFQPSESLAAEILTQLADPAQSLLSVARSNNISVESLCLWLSRPEITERISAMRSAAALRTRWLAADHLPACAELASRIVRASLASPDLTAPEPALRAARLLLRLASFDPNARPRSAPVPTPQPPPNPRHQVESIPPIAEAPDETSSQSDSSDISDSSETPSLQLPPGLLTSLLPSFKDSDRNPFLPEPGLLKTAPNQRALVKMRLKLQQKQILDEAFKFLLDHHCCVEADLPLVRREIESFYLRAEKEPRATTSRAARSPPPPPPTSVQTRSERRHLLSKTAAGA
ncbi:MAG: hypothetical protein ACREJD_08770 [Phycisphaerales bacterium]